VTANSALRRGDAVRVRLGPVEGSEQSGERPGLVIPVAAIASRETERVYPFEAPIEAPEGGLARRSKALLMLVRCLDKRRVLGRYGSLGEITMARVDAALRISTGLTQI